MLNWFFVVRSSGHNSVSDAKIFLKITLYFNCFGFHNFYYFDESIQSYRSSVLKCKLRSAGTKGTGLYPDTLHHYLSAKCLSCEY
jgi:hypothetical protein